MKIPQVTQPVTLSSAVNAFANSALGALVLLGVVDWSSEQVAGIMGVVSTGVALAGIMWGRSRRHREVATNVEPPATPPA